MKEDDNEEKLLRSVALQNAQAVFLARERAEQDLRESNQRITDILESITDAFIVLDKEWRFTYLNARSEEMLRPLNKSRSDLLGKSYWLEFPDLIGTSLEKHFRRAVSERVRVEFEIFYPPLNSWFQVRAYPAPDGLCVYYLNTTDQKQGQIDTNLLAAIVDSSDDAIISKNLDGIITSWNRSAERLFGYKAAEAIGQHITLIIPAYRRSEEELIIERLRRGERVDHFETVRLRKDGTSLELSLTISPVLDASGQVVGASKVARDITERKQVERALRESEERFRAIFEATPECVKIVAADGTLRHMNSSGLRMVGADRPEMVVGKNVYDLIAPEDRDCFRRFNESICHGNRGSLKFDIIGLHGWRRHMESHAVPFNDRDGIVVQLAVARDITERKHIEERLATAEKMAAAGHLAASLAHEINNPLSSVMNILYLLQHHTAMDAPARDQVTTAANEITRVSRIVKQSLAYYRQETTPREIDLGVTVQESFEVYGEKLERARIHLTKKVGKGTILGFPDEIRQVIDNLLLNGIEAMPSGGRLAVYVHPSVDWKEGNRKGIRLTIADSGIGISRDMLSKIFEPFFTTKLEKGTGLGLWVVRGLVLKHEGTIRVRSSHGNKKTGTVISVFWPLSTQGRGEPAISLAESVA
jgi:PAS domain S-box-containing protein